MIRSRLPLEVFQKVFAFSLRPLRRAGLIEGKHLGIDSTLTEANASLEKLVRREDGVGYAEYVAGLAAEAGIDPGDKAAVARFDRQRPGRRTSNQEWVSPNDPDASIGPRKDGAWDMIHKVENVVDLDSGAILSTEIQRATKTDSTGSAAHMETAAAMADHAAGEADPPEEDDSGPDDEDDETGGKRFAAGDKGYHKNEELAELVAAGIEPVIATPAGRAAPTRNKEHGAAFEANQKNRRSEKGRSLMRARAEKVERSFQHMLDWGGARRTTLTGHENIGKRLLMSAFTFNMAIFGRNTHGFGTLKQELAGNWWKGKAEGSDPVLGGLMRTLKRSLETAMDFVSHFADFPPIFARLGKPGTYCPSAAK